MQFLHDTARVVHGDLKSNNILLCVAPTSPYGRTAKVADFGLAKVYEAGETHRSTKTLGTVSCSTWACSFLCGPDPETSTSVRGSLGWTRDTLRPGSPSCVAPLLASSQSTSVSLCLHRCNFNQSPCRYHTWHPSSCASARPLLLQMCTRWE